MRRFDYEKCIGCYRCVNDCINENIEINEETKHPQFKERGVCINCGHCNAICPKSAITVAEGYVELCGENALLESFAMKRTCRHYKKNEAVDRQKLDMIIQAGQTAPTDRNRKTVRIILVKEKLNYVYGRALDYLIEKVKRNGNIDPLYFSTMKLAQKREEVLWNAEYLVLLVGAEKHTEDAAIAAERMQLMGHSLGIASAYRGDMKTAINEIEELKQMLDIKRREEVLVAFVMGVPQIQFHSAAVKNNKKVDYF